MTNRSPRLSPALLSTLGAACLLAALPAHAETELEALKREVAEQRRLIDELLRRPQAAAAAPVTATPATTPAATPAPTAPAAPSRNSWSLYGVADVGAFSTDSGFGRKTTIGSGGYAASRLGVKGQRQVSQDWNVVGAAEAGLFVDTGSTGNGAVIPGVNATSASTGAAVGTGSQLFSRQIFAGMASDRIGSFTIGRQYTGSYLAAAVAGSALGTSLYGYSGAIIPTNGMPTRVNSSLVYQSPVLFGAKAHLTYTTGSENNTDTDTAIPSATTTRGNDKSGRGIDAALFYTLGSLNVAATGWNVYRDSYLAAGETALAKRRGWQLAANYDFKVLKLFGTASKARISGGNYENVTAALSKTTAWSLSAVAPFGPHRVYATYTKFDDQSSLNRDAKLIGVGYTYDLDAATKLYTAWGTLQNNPNATYSLADSGNLVGNVTRPGYNPKGFMAGLNFVF